MATENVTDTPATEAPATTVTPADLAAGKPSLPHETDTPASDTPATEAPATTVTPADLAAGKPSLPHETDTPASDTPATEAPAADMFPREYVEELRAEAKDNRLRAADRDQLAESLHNALIRLDGRLASPELLPFDPENVRTPEALAEEITRLIDANPRFSSKATAGDIGQGQRAAGGTVDLISIMRGN